MRKPDQADELDKPVAPTVTSTLSNESIRYSLDETYRGIPHVVNLDKNMELLENNEYFDLLKRRITEDRLSAMIWFENRCNDFWISENAEKRQIIIERHGYHAEGCPGDPNFAPRLDTFIIDKNTNEIYWYDVVKNSNIPYNDWAAGISPITISSQNAVDIVRALPEVEMYIEHVKDGAKIEIDRETDELWVVHVYTVQDYPEDEGIPSHSATFNWYSVNKNTGTIDCSFFIYKDGKLDRRSGANEYPCYE